MLPAQTMLRSAFNRRALTSCIVAPLAVIALVAPLDSALARSSGDRGSPAPAQSHIATLPVKQPIGHPVVINASKPALGVNPVLSKREREVKLPHKLESCIEHGGCSGVIQTAGSPKPLSPYPVSFPIGAKPPVPTDSGYGAPSNGSGEGGPPGGGSPIDNDAIPIKQF